MRRAWVDAVTQLGGDGSIASSSAADLERRYGEPHRRYHTAAHIQAVLQDSAWLAGELDLDADERAVLVLVACAHDVVYDAKPGDDERASARWARENLSAAGVAGDLVQRVQQLVLLTGTHAGDADDAAAGALLDADLAILATEPEVYAWYAAAVREEYVAVPDDQWRIGRAQVLTALLARHPLFVTAAARRRWEAAARRNVELELELLRP